MHVTGHPVHDNVTTWTVAAETKEGEYEAPIGSTLVADGAGDQLATVDVYVSLIDGAIVVQIDTDTEHEVPVRVTINDGPDGTIFNEIVEP